MEWMKRLIDRLAGRMLGVRRMPPRARRNLPPPPARRIPFSPVSPVPPVGPAPEPATNSGQRTVRFPRTVTFTAEERLAQRIARQSGK
jgi:hypothetical protein